MARLTTADSLEGILNILTELSDDYFNRRQPTAGNDTSDVISNLMTGLAGMDGGSVGGTGAQLESLARGISAFDELNIEQSDIDFVVSIVSRLDQALASVEFDAEKTKGIYAIAQALMSLGSINEDMLDNIMRLNDEFTLSRLITEIQNLATFDAKTIKKANDFFAIFQSDIGTNIKNFMLACQDIEPIDPEVAKSIKTFITELDLNKIPKLTEASHKSLTNIMSLMTAIVSLTRISFIDALTLPTKGKMVGKAIAVFFDEIDNHIPKKQIRMKLDGIGELMMGMVKLLEGNYGVWRMKRVLSDKNAHRIGGFFGEILKQLPNKRLVQINLEPITQLVTFLHDFTFKDYIKLKTILTKKRGAKIGEFFSAILTGLPNKRNMPDLKPISDFLLGITKMSFTSMLIAKKVLTQKTGEGINKFITSILKGLDRIQLANMKTFSQSMKDMSVGMMWITGSIALMAGTIALAGLANVLAAGVALTAFSWTMLKIVKKFVTDRRTITSGAKVMKDVSIFISLMSLNIAALTIVTAFLDKVPIASFMKLGVVYGILLGSVAIMNKIAKTWNRQGKDIMFALAGISVALIGTSFTIGILTNIAANNALVDVVTGVAILGGAMFGVIKVLKSVASFNGKNLMHASVAMMGIAGCMIGASLAVKLIVGMAADNDIEDIMLGVGVLGATMGGMILLMKALNKVHKKALMSSIAILGGLTLITSAVAMMIRGVFVPIGEYGKEAMTGGSVVLGAITIMIGELILMRFVSKKNLAAGLLGMAGLTAITAAVGLITSTLFIPIGKFAGEAALGGTVVLGALLAMIGEIVLLNRISNKNLKHSILAMAGLTLITGATALIIKELFIPIGKFTAEAALGGLVVFSSLLVMTGMVMLLNVVPVSKVTKSLIAMAGLTLITSMTALVAKELFVPIGRYAKEAALGGVVVLGAMLVMIGELALLNLVKDKNLAHSVIAMAGLTLITAAVGLIVKELFVPIGRYAKEAALGGTVVMASMVVMTGIVFALSKINTANITKSLIAMAGIAVITTITSLIVKELFVPIGKYAAEAALGGTVVTGTIAVFGAMAIGISHMVSKIKKSDLIKGLFVMAGITLFTAMSIGVAMLFVKLAEQMKGLSAADVIFTGDTMVLLIGVFGLLGYGATQLAKKISKKDLITAGAIMLALDGIIAATVATTKYFVSLAELMKNVTAEDVLMAGSTMVGLMGSFGLLLIGAAKLTKSISLPELAVAGLLMVGVDGIIAATVAATKYFVELAQMMNTVSASDLLAAGGTMVALVGIFGGLMIGIAALSTVTGGIGAGAMGVAEAIMLGLAGVIAATSLAVKEYVDLALKIASAPNGAIMSGSSTVMYIIDDFAELMAKFSLLSPFMAIGEVIMLPTLGIINLTGKVMTGFTDILVEIYKKNGEKPWEDGNLKHGYDVMSGIIDGYGNLLSQISLAMVLETIGMVRMMDSLQSTGKVIAAFVDVITYTTTELKDPAIIETFFKTVVGDGTKDTKSLIGSTSSIVSAFMEIGRSIMLGWNFSQGLSAADRVLDICSKYIDVIAKVASLTYVSGYDDNGRPIFDHIYPETFGKAADVVNVNFFNFVDKLKEGFTGLDFTTAQTIRIISGAMNPLIDTMGKFVDVIMKLATATIPVAYDDQGRPIEFESLDPNKFKTAATNVTNAFSEFVKKLDTDFKDLSRSTAKTLKKLGEAMIPMMEALGGFVDSIVKLTTGTVILSYDENGHPDEIKQILDSDLTAAAEKITNMFILFMNSVADKAKEMSRWQAGTVKKLGEGMGPMLKALGSFTDAILKIGAGVVTVGYDEDGKPITKTVKMTEMSNAAEFITNAFTQFMKTIVSNSQKLKDSQVEALSALSGSMGPIMESVGTFANAIITLASSSYQVTDENGKTSFKKLKYDDVKLAAGQIMGYYTQFVNKVLDLAKQEKFQNGGQEAMKALSKAVGPIMKSVLDFSKMLVEFMKPQGEIIDPTTGKKSTFQINVNTVGDVATKIANAYMTFVSELVKRVGEDKTLEAQVDTVNKSMAIISKLIKNTSTGAKNFAAVVKTISEIKDLDSIAANDAKSPTNLFISSMTNFTSGLFSLAENDYNSLRNTVNGMTNMLAAAYKSVKNISIIINTLSNIKNFSDYEKLFTNFTGSINILMTIPTEIPDISAMDPFMVKVLNVTRHLIKLEHLMKPTIADACKTFINNVEILLTVPTNIPDLYAIEPFMTRIMYTASQMLMLEHVMMSSKMTEACRMFVNNLAILTDPSVAQKAEKVSASMVQFSNDLVHFTDVIDKTTEYTLKFSKSIDTTRESIEALDDQLIKHDAERIRTLERISDSFSKVAKSISESISQLERLDENKILSNYKSIARLLEEANKKAEEALRDVPVKPSDGDKKNGDTYNINNVNNKYGNENDRQNTVIQPIPTGGGLIPDGRETMVTFVFKNTKFTGTATTKQI